MMVLPAEFRFPLPSAQLVCRRCHRLTHHVEFILARGDWRCLRCVEDERVVRRQDGPRGVLVAHAALSTTTD